MNLLRILLVISIIALAIVALISISVIVSNILLAETGQKLLVIEKNVCFDISISTPSDKEPTTKSICLVVDFYIYNVRSIENASVVIEFPITITVYNQTITRKVIVPLNVIGSIERIEIKNPYGGNEVIYVLPPTTTTTPAQVQTQTPAQQTPSVPVQIQTTTVQQTSTPVIERTVTVTVPPIIRETTVTISPQTQGIVIPPAVLIIVVIIVIAVAIVLLLRRKPRREEEERITRETIRKMLEEELMRMAEEAEKEEAKEETKAEAEEEKREEQEKNPLEGKKVYCSLCKSLISPIVTDDNRVLCPKCRCELGRIEEGVFEKYEKPRCGEEEKEEQKQENQKQ